MKLKDIHERVPEYYRWELNEMDLHMLAERLREEPVEYYKEAAYYLDALQNEADAQ